MSWWSDDFINKAPMCDASAIEKCIQNCQKKCYEQFPFSANACDCFGRERTWRRAASTAAPLPPPRIPPAGAPSAPKPAA